MKDGVREGLHIKCTEGGERICHRRRRKKILGDELIRNELSYVIIVYSVFLQWKNLWFNAAFHEGTFQNSNFHVVNNLSKYEGE